jgi:hypothetical protein
MLRHSISGVLQHTPLVLPCLRVASSCAHANEGSRGLKALLVSDLNNKPSDLRLYYSVINKAVSLD